MALHPPLLTAGLCLWHGLAAAQAADYPNRPVRLGAPSAAGGTIDVTARLVAEKLKDQLGHPVVVDHRPGANSAIGMSLVAKAPPDGYTLMFIASNFNTSTLLYRSFTLDPINDFSPAGRSPGAPFTSSRGRTIPWKNWSRSRNPGRRAR